MKRLWIPSVMALALLVCCVPVHGQQTSTSKINATASGQTLTFSNAIQGGTSLTIHYALHHSPTAFTGVLQGVSSSGTVAVLDTYSNISDGTDTVSLSATYSYFQDTMTWTGANVNASATLTITGPGPSPVIPTVTANTLFGGTALPTSCVYNAVADPAFVLNGTTLYVCGVLGTYIATGVSYPLTFSGASVVPSGASLTFQSGSTFSCLAGSTCNAATASNLSGTPALPNGVAATTQSQLDGSIKLATTSYTDTAVSNALAATNPAIAVLLATTSSADTSGLTYSNGVAGVGATFTGTINTALTIDGTALTAVGQRVLVKNDTQSPSGAFNGIYSLTQLQTSLLPPILTRVSDYNTPSNMNNTGAIPVQSGTVNGSTSWLMTAHIVTVGTTALTFAQFSYAPAAIPTLAGNNTFTGSNAYGTPASIVLTNATGTAASLSIGGNAATATAPASPPWTVSVGGTGATTSTGSGAVVLQNQPTINGLSFNNFAGLANNASPTVADVPGSGGSLLASTTYYYDCVGANLIGNTAVPAVASVTTSGAGGGHSVQVTCPTVTGASAYGFYGRSSSVNIYFISSCTGAATPVSQCSAANVLVDDGSITPTIQAQLTSQNTSYGLGFGPSSGGPSGASTNASPNDTWLTRTAPDTLSLGGQWFVDPTFNFVTAGGTASLSYSHSTNTMALSKSLGVTGSVSSTTLISAGSYIVSGVNSIAYSTTPALDFSKGNTQQFSCTTAGAAIAPTVAGVADAKGLPGGAVILVQNGSTACTWAWPVHMYGAPAVSTTLSSINTFHFTTSANGTDMYYIGGTQGITGGTP